MASFLGGASVQDRHSTGPSPGCRDLLRVEVVSAKDCETCRQETPTEPPSRTGAGDPIFEGCSELEQLCVCISTPIHFIGVAAVCRHRACVLSGDPFCVIAFHCFRINDVSCHLFSLLSVLAESQECWAEYRGEVCKLHNLHLCGAHNVHFCMFLPPNFQKYFFLGNCAGK